MRELMRSTFAYQEKGYIYMNSKDKQNKFVMN